MRHSAAKAWGATHRARSLCSLIVCWQVDPATFLKVSAPVAALARTGGRLPWCSFAEDDPALAEIVGCHFDMYAVSNDRSDAVATHFSRRVADNAMLIIESDAETSIGQDFVDRALHRNKLFLRQTTILTYKNNPRGRIPQQSQLG